MAHELIVPGLTGNVLSTSGVGTLFLRPGTVTGVKLPLFNSPVGLSAAVAAAHSSVGHEGPVLQERADQLRPRPLYVLRGPEGKLCLMAGPVGATDLLPANTRWFRTLLDRPMTSKAADLNWSNTRDSSPKLSAWRWDLESRVACAIHPNPEGKTIYHALQQDMLDLWRQRTGLGGVAVFSWHASGIDYNVLMPSGPAVAPTYAGYWGRDDSSYSTRRAISPLAMASLDDHAHVPVGVQVASQMSWAPLSTNQDDLSLWWETCKSSATPQSYRLTWGMSQKDVLSTLHPYLPYVYARVSTSAAPGRFQPDHDYLVDRVAPLGAVGLNVETVRIGSILPFPLASTRVGYVYGLPHEPVAVIWTGVAQADPETAILDFQVESSSTYVTGAQYKRLFPLATLPAEKAASLQQKWEELPDDLIFLVNHYPAGLKYKSLEYDETVIARDLARAGESLDSLLFDHVDETQPPITYKSLGARSREAISKKRNSVIVLPLAPDGEGTTDLSPIVFKLGIGGFISATRADIAIDEADALIAIKARAPYSFLDGLTADRVALELYAMPTWEELMTVEGDSEQTDYVLDEARLTYEGTFDFTTDDELARALPTLLGFDRSQFGAVVAAVAYGVPKPTLKDA